MKWEYDKKTKEEIEKEYKEYLSIMSLFNRCAKNYEDWLILNNYIIK